jgi:membrane-bound lytic murein transglycosylase A
VQFEPVGWDALPGWYSDPIEQAWPALQQSCRALARRNAAQAWLDICRRAQALDTNRQTSPAVIRAFFEREFVAHRLRSVDTDGTSSDEGLITGYYEPLLRGSRTRDARYRYPLYAAPDDLLVVDMGSLYPALQGQRVRARIDGRRVVPYYPRAQIARGVPSLTGRELVWVDDRLDAFFLEIQGSGRVQLPDGSVMRLGYAEQNGHPYRAIGRVLVERGDLTLEEATMQGIRRWAEANPDRVTELLDANPSQVFFRELPAPAGSAPGSPAASAPGNTAASGPPGSLGVPLTPMRSIAIDPRSVMLGAPVWLATFDPRNGKPLERLTFAQDTGGAIIGAIRADLFWGFGSAAGEAAGRMRERGRLWVLLPKEGR